MKKNVSAFGSDTKEQATAHADGDDVHGGVVRDSLEHNCDWLWSQGEQSAEGGFGARLHRARQVCSLLPLPFTPTNTCLSQS